MVAAALARTLVEPDRLRSPCRHCARPTLHRGRGLCNKCHKDRGVRCRYRSLSPCGRRTNQFSHGRRRLPAEPTAALPGTEAKVAVLRARAGRGESLWHPQGVRTMNC